MRFLPPETQVQLYEEGFGDDLLGRVKVGKTLSELLDKIEDPLVVALDGRWGTGKSYFLKRWVGAHRLQNNGRGLTIYFDAFAHDYLSDPLAALVGALANRVPPKDKGKLGKVKNAAFKLLKPISRVGLAVATAGATEALSAIGDAVANAVNSEAGRAVEEYWKREEGRQAAMQEFHAAIEALTANSEPGATTPLIIVIDELDRCRPDYALELLEVIKHFFSVPHVHFVLGANLVALENIVKSRYGNGIDAAAYLRKFINLTISLPDIATDKETTSVSVTYAAKIGKDMGVSTFLLDEICKQIGMIERESAIPIREVGKILSLATICPKEARSDDQYPGYRMATVTLIIAKVVHPDLYARLVSGRGVLSDIESFLSADQARLREYLQKDQRNPEYDHNTFVRFKAWSYILSGGRIEDDASQSVARLFDRFGQHRNAKTIPIWVHERWLSRFEVS